MWDCLIWRLQGDSKLRGQLGVTQMKGGRVVGKAMRALLALLGCVTPIQTGVARLGVLRSGRPTG